MRKFMLAAVLAVLGAAVFATSAAAFDHHFTVISKEKSGHQVGNTFRFKDRLLDPDNRHDKVGRLHGLCRFKHPGKTKCHARVHLNGEIGGFGDIRFRGDLDGGPNHLVVLGGSADFDGVAGKVTDHNTKKHGVDRLHFDLVR